MNVLLITIDSLRTDHLHCYGYSRNVSPCIDELASSGVLFSEAFSHGGGTPEAFPSILASTLPPITAFEFNQIMKRNVNIAEILRRKGYRTAAFHSNPYLSRFFNYDRGFDSFWDNIGATVSVRKLRGWSKNLLSKLISKFFRKRGPIAKAAEITDKAIHWLKENHGKFFLWIHYMDVHHPYMPPKNYVRQLSSSKIVLPRMLTIYKKLRNHRALSTSEQRMLIGFYDASIEYIDDCIKRLLNQVNLSETVVIFTADHGDLLGEHGLYYHGELYEEVIHVPLIVRGPGIESGIEVDQLVTHMDIAPTIAKLSGSEDIKAFQGRNLISIINEKNTETRKVISIALNEQNKIRKISCRDGKWKYIRTEEIDTNKELIHEIYNLERCPGESVNLCKTENRKMLEFESELVNFFRAKQKRTEKGRIRNKIERLKRIE